MSTSQNKQRPTPETDKAIGKWNPGLHEVVTAFFARKLERERDEAREALEWATQTTEAMHTGLHQAKVRIIKLEAENQAMREAIKEAVMIVENGVLNPMVHPSGKPANLKAALAKFQPFIKL